MKNNQSSLFRRVLSTFELMVRATFVPVLLTTVGTVLLQCGVFFAMAKIYAQPSGIMRLIAMEVLVERRFVIPLLAAAGFLLVSWLLAGTGGNRSNKCGYTIQRLLLPERAVVAIQTVYHILCFLLFWAAQVGAMLLLYRIYLAVFGAEAVTSQSLALAFYRGDYLHSLLPIGDSLGFAFNGTVIAVLGFTTAVYPYQQRRGQKGWSNAFLLGWPIVLFSRGIGELTRPGLLGFFLLFGLLQGLLILTEGKKDEEAAE